MTKRLKRPLVPLSEARRKMPKLNEAAVFVETLFGRPLLNNPAVDDRRRLLPRLSNDGRILSPGKNIRHMVHELVHSEDYYKTPLIGPGEISILDRIKGALKIKLQVYTEGRAIFASHLFRDKIRRFELNFVSLAVGLYGAVASGVDAMPSIPTIGWMIMLVNGITYWPFHNALCSITKKIGDPIEAFRLTTEKPPNFVGLIFPLKFYRRDIEKKISN